MTQVYTKKNFKVYNKNKSFIIHNSNKSFEDGHTHIQGNLHTCIYLIDLSIHKSIPRHISKYMAVSLIRLSDDDEYKQKIGYLLSEMS